MEERELVLVPEETLHQLLVQGLGHEIIFASDHEYFVGVDSAVLNSIKVQGLPHEVIQFKPLKVVVRIYPLNKCIYTEYGYITPFKFVPKLFSGALGPSMPEEVNSIINKRFMETTVGRKIIQVQDIVEYVALTPIEFRLTPPETLHVIKHLLNTLGTLGQRVRVRGFEEIGLKELAKQYNSTLKH